MSEGGRYLRNRAPIDYTSCFYKNKVSRDEPRSQKSDIEPVAARRTKRKLSQESETSPEDLIFDQERVSNASEPLDKTNEDGRKDGDTRQRSRGAKKHSNRRQGTSPGTDESSGEHRADENAGSRQQRASSSKHARTVDGQPAHKRRKPSLQKKGPSKGQSSSEQQKSMQRSQSRRSDDSYNQQPEQAAQMQFNEPAHEEAAIAAEQAEAPRMQPQSPRSPQQRAAGALRSKGASGLKAGRASEEEVVDRLFGTEDAGPSRPAVHQNVHKLASMWDQTLKHRLDAAQQYSATLQAQNKALVTANTALESELKRHDDVMTATVKQFSEEKARIVKNYQLLYAKFQEIRSRDREDIMEVIDSIWEAIDDHKQVAEKVAAAWKEEALAQKTIVEECAAPETLERLQTLEKDNLKLQAQVLDEGHMVMLATQEINELKSLVATLRAGKPPTVDFACTAAPETHEAGCSAMPDTADVAVGLGKGAQWGASLGPVAAARARRRTDLGVTRLACDMVPEGVDVNSLDTDVLRLGLIKPTDPSVLESILPMQQPIDIEVAAAAPGLPAAAPAPHHVPTAAMQPDSPLQQQVSSQQAADNDINIHTPDSPVASPAAASPADPDSIAAEAPAEIAEPAFEPVLAHGASGLGAAEATASMRLSSSAAHGAAANAIHRITPPHLGSTTAPAAAAAVVAVAQPALQSPPQRRLDSIQASNGPPMSPFGAAIAAASRVAAVADAATVAAAAVLGHEPQPEAPAELLSPPEGLPPNAHAADKPQHAIACRHRTSASTVEQGGGAAAAAQEPAAVVVAVNGPALKPQFASPDHIAPLRDATRKIASDPLPGAHKRTHDNCKPFEHLLIPNHPKCLDRKQRVLASQKPPAAAKGVEVAAAADATQGRILSPVEEEPNTEAAPQPCGRTRAHGAQIEALPVPFPQPRGRPQHVTVEKADDEESVDFQPTGKFICSVGEDDDCALGAADGGKMSTSESDRSYGDNERGPAPGPMSVGADDEAGSAPVLEAEAFMQQDPLVQSELQEDASAAGGIGSGQKFLEVEQQQQQHPEDLNSQQREAQRWAVSESVGIAGSARTTASLSKYDGFRDKMLGMELRMNKDGSEQWAKHLASGFSFTLKVCTPLNPRVDGRFTDGPPDEVTYVPHMDRCPEHISAALPSHWKSEFDFAASDLHMFQQRIDRALEEVMKPAAM